jgi:serine/threonine protein kinase/Tol biopolymer transport system component
LANLAGKKVSHYRVLEMLGGGGMGVVYKAEDIKLGRSVALKFLPEELGKDPKALERFEREARAASALNHPNICTVYEFGEHEGQPFIAMELLEGQTLRERIAKPLTPGPSPQGRGERKSLGVSPSPQTQGIGERKSLEVSPSPVGRGCPDIVGTGEGPRGAALPNDTLLDLGIQIADGLDAAHQKGITHRDIKPANVFITTRGQAKILDFGLAKLAPTNGPRPVPGESEEGSERGGGAQDTPTASALDPHLTKTGVAMGTACYMSPEQVRGEKVDARTDLFSFGLVLYEMATGQQAFKGETVTVVRDAILSLSPTPVRQWNPEVPAKLEEIISKALEKDRELRYHSSGDLRADLKRLKREVDSGRSRASGLDEPAATAAGVPGELRRRPAGKRSRRVALVGGLALTAVAASWVMLSRRGSRPSAPVRIVPFSGLSGLEQTPAFSPDGSQLAYSWNGGSGTTFHIYAKLIGVGAPLQLTHSALTDCCPAWSPDGRYIAFFRFSPSGGDEVISVPALGGPERRLAEVDSWGLAGWALLAWAPDGKSLAIRQGRPPAVVLVSVENGEQRQVTRPPAGSWGDADPAFSPDGRQLAFIRWPKHDAGDLYLQDLNSGEARRLLADGTFIAGMAWTPDGRAIIFSSGRSGLQTLWKVSLSGGEVEPVTGPGEQAIFPAVSPPGHVLAYEKFEVNANIWSIRIGPSGGGAGSPIKIISGSGQQFDSELSPDGQRIAFGSNASGNKEIWLAKADGADVLQLTSLRVDSGTPLVS